MYTPTPRKRKRGIMPVVEGDAVLADAVVRRTVTKTKRDGSTVTKEIWVSMDDPPPMLTPVASGSNRPEMPTFENEPQNMSPPPNMPSPPPERTQSYRVRIYIKLS
jgi:hypothetical protein